MDNAESLKTEKKRKLEIFLDPYIGNVLKMQKVTNSNPPSQQEVIAVLTASETPCSINYVAKRLNIAWVTARAILLKLVIEGTVKMRETTTGMIFWVDSGSRSP